MTDPTETEWNDLLRDVNETLGLIEDPQSPSLAGNPGWLEGLRKSATFSRLPADKLAAAIQKLEEVPIQTGDVVIREKDRGDYFYIVKSGSLTVSRRTGPGEFEILARLEEGDAFGEAALLSGEARNASIFADRDSVLLRLAKSDFDALLRNDLVRRVSMLEARALARDGARFLDVRRDSLGRNDTLDGALSIPVDKLRGRLGELDPGTTYIVYCLNGNLSETAAFVLGQRGYPVVVLRGGLEAQR